MYNIFKKKNNIPNIPEHKIQESIPKAIENKAIENEIISDLGMSHKDLGQILISCPICNYSFYLEKACGVTRCCNSNTNKLESEKLLVYIVSNGLQHCTENVCKELRQTYPNACLTPLLILTIDYEQYKDINICLSTLPYYF